MWPQQECYSTRNAFQIAKAAKMRNCILGFETHCALHRCISPKGPILAWRRFVELGGILSSGFWWVSGPTLDVNVTGSIPVKTFWNAKGPWKLEPYYSSPLYIPFSNPRVESRLNTQDLATNAPNIPYSFKANINKTLTSELLLCVSICFVLFCASNVSFNKLVSFYFFAKPRYKCVSLD